MYSSIVSTPAYDYCASSYSTVYVINFKIIPKTVKYWFFPMSRQYLRLTDDSLTTQLLPMIEKTAAYLGPQTMDDTHNAVSKAPLWITPLFQKGKDDRCYRTVKRLVTRTPNPACAGTAHGEVETSLEEYLGPSGEILWRRVAVRGYTDTDPVLHASFTLRSDEGTTCASIENDGYKEVEDHIICWTSFPERPEHKVLCVLASPLLLCIWDVYPSNNGDTADESIGGEGHSVTLPFEARGIFPLAQHHGLLLQRNETMEDRVIDESAKRSSTWMSRGVMDDEYDDGGFVLQDPPNPVRLGLASPSGMEMTITQPSPMASSAEPVPSLFSLRHPLDELRPMTMRGSDSSYSLFSDVNEQVLFTGTPCWTDHNDGSYEKKEYSQPICVTYNGRLKRYGLQDSLYCSFMRF
jgi:hypothetical protein